jgi:hypothetical protein
MLEMGLSYFRFYEELNDFLLSAKRKKLFSFEFRGTPSVKDAINAEAVMIELIPIEVECHSGYKADEYPKCFYWNNSRFEIKKVTDRWYQGEINPEWPASDYFSYMIRTFIC